MKLERPDDDEFEMLLDEIPHATSHHQQHHQQHQHDHTRHVDVLNGNVFHGCSPTHTIHGIYGDDNPSSPYHGHAQNGHGHSGHVNHSHGSGILGMFDDEPSSCHGYVCASPVSRVSLQSEGSLSSTLSGRLSPDDGGSPPIKYQTPRKTQHPHGFWPLRESESPEYSKNVDGSLMNDLGLSDKLQRMTIRGVKEEDAMKFERLPSLGNDWPLGGAGHGNVLMKSPVEDYRNGFSNDYGRFRCSGFPNSTPFDAKMSWSMLGLQQQQQQQFHMGNLSGSCLDPRFSYRYVDNLMNYPWKQPMNEHMRYEALSNPQSLSEAALVRNYYYDRGIQVPNIVPSSINRPAIGNAFFHSQQNAIDSTGEWGSLESPGLPYAALQKVPPGVGNLPHYNLPMFSDSGGQFPNGRPSQTALPMGSVPGLDAFTCEDSLIIQGKNLNYGMNDRRCRDDSGRGHSIDKNSSLDVRLRPVAIPTGNSEMAHGPRVCSPPILPPKYSSLQEVEGYIYFIAKDQHGCRFLQRKFDEGTPQDVQMIFNEIVDHVVELMMNPFGNYLMQKLLDVCTEEQKMKILLMVTGKRGELVRISLNTHGTRAVQKLVETLKTQQQISLVVSSLEPGFLDLIKDLNGNHVVQRCLQCLSAEDNKFIFDAAAKYCVEIATHRHGCCVLQRCIAHSTGKHRENLVAEISSNGLHLSQDPFGNYVVQFILELKIPSAIANLILQFKGNYVNLSMQKFSSNVVEKCLKFFSEENRSTIIHELLSTSQFEQLLQDPYANYVIQSALVVSKGPLHAALVEAIRPHAAVLRTSPYCKRIFSRALLKK